MLRVLPDEVNQRALLTTLRNMDLHAPLVPFRENLFQRRTVLEIDGHVNRVRHILLIQIDLLQQRREELARLESRAGDGLAQVLPEELAPVHDLAAAHVEEV